MGCLLMTGQGLGQTGLFADLNLIDDGQYAAWVNNMFYGKVIYRDIYVQYGPLSVFPVYFLMMLFGHSFFFVKFWNLVQAAIAVTFVMLILRSYSISKYLQFLTFLSLILIPGANLRYMIGAMVLASFIFGVSKRSFALMKFSGVLLALSFFTSIEVGIFTFVVLSTFLIAKYVLNRNAGDLLIAIKNFISGFFVTTSLFLLVFGYQGWLGSYLATTFEFIFALSGADLPNGYGLPNIFRESGVGSLIEIFRGLISRYSLFYISFILLSSFISGLIIRVILHRRHADIFFLLLSLYTLLIYLSIIGRSGHFFNTFPFVIFIGVYLVDLLVKHLNRRRKTIASLFVLVLVTLFVLRYIIIVRVAASETFKLYERSVSIERAQPLRISLVQSNNLKPILDFISDKSSSEDSIYILNNSPGLYFLVNRKNATRYDLPLLAGTLDKRLEIVSQLSQNSPKFIIEDLKAWDVDEVSDMKRMPEIFDFVKENYIYSRVVGNFRVYSKEPF